ncbi:MAG: NAD(P)H-hydrate dehydratase [Christensenellales bacterium]|jgi:hydroxyethylthiazole kinase-like uncharacterized protein yjeF
MVTLATWEQLREAERRFPFADGGISLMAAAAGALAARIREIGKFPVWFLCGPGNNGGDGLWVAALLRKEDPSYSCAVLRVYPEIPYIGDAAEGWKAVLEAGVPVYDADGPQDSLPGLVVDAIFGIGGGARPFDKRVKRLLTRAARWKEQGARILACDIPSGLSQAGAVQPETLAADETLTFLAGKAGLLLYPGRRYAGIVREITFSTVNEDLFTGQALYPSDIPSLLPQRPEWGHKGTFGHTGVLAGSRGMSGAGALCGLGALHSGCGKVTWLHPDFPVQLPYCLMEQLLPGEKELIPSALSDLNDVLPDFQALAVGPGLGRSPATAETLAALLPKLRMPVVLDADGIWNLAGITFPSGMRGVMTPHPGEMARFLSCGTDDVTGDLLSAALKAAEKTGLVVLLKGAVTVIADPEKRFALLPLPNSGMATAGSGDVLSGILAGLLARGMEPWDAARLGGLLHAAGGAWAASTLGASYMTAEDILSGLRADHCGFQW